MTTFKIILSQLRHMYLNRNSYLLICTPCFVISIIIEYQETLVILTTLIYITLYYLIAVNVHRLVILGENKNYFSFSKRFKPTLYYFGYSLLIIIFSWGCWLLCALTLTFGLDILSYNIVSLENFFLTLLLICIFGLLIILAIFSSFIVYPSLALNLPLASIGEKVSFFKMWKLSKGFKLTIFLQFVIILLFYIIISIPIIWFFNWDFSTNIIISFLSILMLALTVSCLSKTFLLWKETN